MDENLIDFNVDLDNNIEPSAAEQGSHEGEGQEKEKNEARETSPDANVTVSAQVIAPVAATDAEVKVADTSAQSIVEPDTLFYLPYQDVFLDGLPTKQRKGNKFQSHLSEKGCPEREERKKVLQKLILQRLVHLGTPNVAAHDIMDTWSMGYVQHRALSYRIPKMRLVSKDKVSPDVDSVEVSKPLKIRLGPRLTDSLGFIESFIYHSNFLKGILNSATCTVLECTFFLMLPHFKTRTENNANHLPGAGISPSFIKDWINIITTAAYQLKPTEPGAIVDLVKKETKLVAKLLLSLEKTHKKMKEKIVYIQDKLEILKDKTFDQIKLQPELASKVENEEEPEDYAGFAHLQIVGFTGPQIFPNFLHFLLGKYGLFLKKNAEEPWFPFSDLNFLERRVIFLGLTDHLYSSFEAVQATIRHLEEIYTPGYPMNLLTRFKPLMDLLSHPKPYQLLATESKRALYGASCSCIAAFKRFKYVYKELITMVKDANIGIQKLDIHSLPVAGTSKFSSNFGAPPDKGNKITMIVPFATLDLEAFANLSQRGITISAEQTKKEKE